MPQGEENFKPPPVPETSLSFSLLSRRPVLRTQLRRTAFSIFPGS